MVLFLRRIAVDSHVPCFLEVLRRNFLKQEAFLRPQLNNQAFSSNTALEEYVLLCSRLSFEQVFDLFATSDDRTYTSGNKSPIRKRILCDVSTIPVITTSLPGLFP